MTVTTLSRLWGEILILAGLQVVLTAVLVTGGTEHCGEKRRCGYGARCYNDTSGCVCLSDDDKPMKQEGNPNTVFYCLGEGVKQCGDQLCGYGAECDTAKIECGCSRDNVVRTQLEDTFPVMWYCVEKCTSGRTNCPENTTCTDRTGDKKYRCYCSAGATQSSTGQCLGNITTVAVKSTFLDTTESVSPIQHEGVRRCGDHLCGYRTECHEGKCGCSFSNGELPELEDTSPTLWYCVEKCSSGNRNCPENTTCRDRTGGNNYRCECSAGATQSSTGQCLGNVTPLPVESTVHDTTESASPTEHTTLGSGVIPKEDDPSNQCNNKKDDSQTLTIGLAAGISAGVLLAGVVMVVLIRKHRRLKARENCVLENTLSNANTLSTEFNHSYENVLSLSLHGESRPDSPSIPADDRPSVGVPDNNSPNTYVNVSASSQSPENNDTSGLYESANTPNTSEVRLYTTLGQI